MRRPPISTLTDTLFPDTTLFRSVLPDTLLVAGDSSTSPPVERASRPSAVITPAAVLVMSPALTRASVPAPTSTAAPSAIPAAPAPALCRVRLPEIGRAHV